MATPNTDDDSDHDEQGSVVAYQESDLDVPPKTPLQPEYATNTSPHNQSDDVFNRSGELKPNCCYGVRIRRSLRNQIADLCDSNVWELVFVVLSVVYVVLVVLEVSIYAGYIGILSGLRGLSATSAVLLGLFFVEILMKSIAYELSYWRVPRNGIESFFIIVAFPLQIAVCALLGSDPLELTTAQVIVASRVFRLIICISSYRRFREYVTAFLALRALKSDNLTSVEKTLHVLREIKSTYPLSDVHSVQLQWCIDVILSHRLYSGLIQGPNGEPIRFQGVDDDTSRWLLGTYSTLKEDAQQRRKDPQTNDSGQLRTPAIDTPDIRKQSEPRINRTLSRRDSDGPDPVLTGRRHTSLFLAPSDKPTVATPGDPAKDAVAQSNVQTTPQTAHKRTLSRSSMTIGRSAENLGSLGRSTKGSNLRRGSSFALPIEPVVDLEEGLSFTGSVGQARITTGASLGLLPSDLEFLDNALDHLENNPLYKSAETLDQMNRDIDEWTFDMFALSRLTKGKPLSPCLIATVRKNNVFDAMGSCISVPAVFKFCIEIEKGYVPSNPYHNSVHAADVVQCFHHFLTHRQFRESITPLDRFIGLIAAAIHDFRHPGVNNAFLIATKDPLAVQYNDIAVLESMHVASAFELMRANPELDIFAGLPSLGRSEARETLIQMVLATDMKAHFDILSQFRSQVTQSQGVEKNHENLGLWWQELFPLDRDHSFSSTASAGLPIMAYPLDYRRTILKTALHVADVSNPARPNSLSTQWADLVQEEFFRQGDMERELGLPISMFMDRTKPAFPKSQVGFIEFIVKPLMEAFYGWLRSLKPVIDPHLVGNLEYWKKRLEAELAASQPSGIPPLSPAPVALSATPLDSSKGPSGHRLVALLKTSAPNRHRPSASTGELNFTLPADSSPLQSSTKRSAPIRRTTSDTFKPIPLSDMPVKRQQGSPLTFGRTIQTPSPKLPRHNQTPSPLTGPVVTLGSGSPPVSDFAARVAESDTQ